MGVDPQKVGGLDQGLNECNNYRVSGALEKLEHETNLQDRAADR